MSNPSATSRRWLNSQQIRARYSWSTTTLWDHVRSKRFPAPIKLTPHRNYWSEQAVLDWEREREASERVGAA